MGGKILSVDTIQFLWKVQEEFSKMYENVWPEISLNVWPLNMQQDIS